MKNKIAIIGPYPPPYGGISVHIQRVVKYLPKDRYVLFNTSNSKCEGAISFYGKVKYLKVFQFIFKEYKLIHAHTTDSILRFLLGMIGIFKKNIYIHIHGASLTDFFQRKSIFSYLMKKLTKNINIIASNSGILHEIGIYNPISVREIDAFLPPKFDFNKFNSVVQSYEDFFRNGRVKISMTGWFVRYKNADLYGFDLAAKVVKKFKENGKIIFLVASINGIRDRGLYNSFQEYVNTNNLNCQILLIHEDMEEVWPIFMASQVFIRPTNTDGSSVSIKEALWFETKVVASDCVVRPKNVILFKNRSENDLYEKILYIYQQSQLSIERKISKLSSKSFTNKLFTDVYELQG
ncbi:MAG: glycosyltransferase [Bacteroidales bacterium]|nr:glycosyltransferase [Bacteroidales bacterium]